MVTVQGILKVESDKIYVEVDPGIVLLTRALIPPARRPRPQRYPPHISVVRNECFPQRYIREREVWFTYDPAVVEGEVYWWLRCWSLDLTSLRLSLGLPMSSEWSRPPGNEDCFHITVGNTKELT
jgi:hypothetical protein